MQMSLTFLQVLEYGLPFLGKLLKISDLNGVREDGMMFKIKECAMITVDGLELEDVKVLENHIGLAHLLAQIQLTRKKESIRKEMKI